MEIKPINYALGWGEFLLTIDEPQVLLLLAYIASEGDIKTIRNLFPTFINTLDFSCSCSVVEEREPRTKLLMCGPVPIRPGGVIWKALLFTEIVLVFRICQEVT
jgi:hypothetical protein